MSLILASLFSHKTASAGLMVYDLDSSSSRYVQLVDFSDLPARFQQIRGISLTGDRLYAIAPCAMLIFKVATRAPGPVLILEKTVCIPEWVAGGNAQGNLHAIFVCQERKQVYISFNSQSAIDIFDLEGNYLQRRYLWDIAPKLFPLPCGPVDKDFRFGVVRHMFESEHKELMLTTALMNGTKDSAVISYDNGRSVLNLESQPLHGGLMEKHTLYLCAIQKEEVQSFSWPQDQMTPDIESVQQLSPRITDSRWKGSKQITRGLALQNGRLLCGVCYSGNPKSNQMPPRMVEFDLKSGEQIKEHWLPSFQGLEEPHIYALHPVSKELEQAVALWDEPVIYQGKALISPIWIVRDTPPEKPKKSSENYGLNIIGPDNLQRLSSQLRERKSEVGTENVSDKHSQPTVIFENVGLYFERAARRFLSFKKNLRHKKSFWALRDVSFIVGEGETLGVIGRNGSGKSTLSMICSGVLTPDRGNVMVNGRAQLLALGVGFKNELSGRENVFISGSLMGLSKKVIKSRMEEIEAFAELGEFIDEPIRTYSSGMRSRLGFAVATAVKPDILILDEIMATGDKAFKDKAMRRMHEMRGLARSIIVVSHNPVQLRKLSTRVLWLEKGRMLMLGEPVEVLNAYDKFCQSPARWLSKHPDLANKIASGEIRRD